MAVVMTAVVALLAVVAVATASLGLAYAARAQAQTAADAASLAAAVASYPGTGRRVPVVEAASVAAANGARLVSCRCPMDPGMTPRTAWVVAMVPVDLPVLGEIRVTAAAGAEFDPRRWLGR